MKQITEGLSGAQAAAIIYENDVLAVPVTWSAKSWDGPIRVDYQGIIFQLASGVNASAIETPISSNKWEVRDVIGAPNWLDLGRNYPSGVLVKHMGEVWRNNSATAAAPVKGAIWATLAGVTFKNKDRKLIDFLAATNSRYTGISNQAPGYTISEVSGRVRYNIIPVTGGLLYRLIDVVTDSGNANELRGWVDAQGSFIGSMEVSRLEPFLHKAPRDARGLILSFAAAPAATAAVEQVTNEIEGYPITEIYNKSPNLSNGQIKGFQLYANGIGSNAAGNWLSCLIPVNKDQSYNIYGNYFSFGSTCSAIIYNLDGTIAQFIESMPAEERAVTTSVVAKLFTITPAVDGYLRYEVAEGTQSVINFETLPGAKSIVFRSENYKEMLSTSKSYAFFTNAEILDIVRKEKPVVKDIASKRVLILGTSIEDTGFAQSRVPYSGDKLRGNTGGWVGRMLEILRFNSFYNYANGGWSLTDTSGLFGPPLATGGSNSFLQRLEQFIAAYSATGSTLQAPDIVLICGCTNDFGQALPRYVTENEVTTSGKSYDAYCEESFFLQSDLPVYNNNRLQPLENISRAKIIGALRYIVERVGTLFPNTKFYIVTPIQSTAHALYQQRACVRDYKWAANRMSIPVIDAWGSSQLTMLWDYKNLAGVDNHKLLVDNVHMADATTVQNSVNIMARFVSNALYNSYFDF